jgi:hypothetical protein
VALGVGGDELADLGLEGLDDDAAGGLYPIGVGDLIALFFGGVGETME